ncbi:PhnD/SsuA/transferrin family substrate-binding protein [Castellaniella sp. MT123]|uniref:sensor histidine kinase n=1 Tax=Castellaniella sp. MT123 TaxID=3140381 RepID=UPI0031F3D951
MEQIVRVMGRLSRVVLLAGLVLLTAGARAAGEGEAASLHAWRIGILAPRGPEKALRAWSSWRDWLEQRLPGEHFDLLPIVPDQALRPGTLEGLDFLLANPVQFRALDPRRPVRWLATLKPSGGGDLQFLEQIGSAIWVREDGPLSLADLKGRRVGAVHPEALGGYLLGVELLDREGLAPQRDYVPVFSGFPADRPLLQLAAGQVDAAIVPVCLYEELSASGRLKGMRLRLLEPAWGASDTFPGPAAPAEAAPCASSTRLLPGWSLAALDTVPDGLAAALGGVLLGDSPPAGLPRWSLPVSAADVERRLHRIGYVSDADVWGQLRRLLWHYWPWLVSVLGLGLLLLGNSLWLARVARRQRQRLHLAHEQLHQYEQALAQADRIALLGEMAAGIAHEVKQPLAAILQYVEAAAYRLRAEDRDHPLLPVLGHIRDDVLRCDRVIHNLRGWAKPERPEPVSERQALGALVEQVVGMVRLQADRQGVRIEADIPQALVAGDVPRAFEQVLANVLINAVQAGARCISVRAAAEEGVLRIEVADDGPGFDAEHVRFPFVPFRTTRPDGLGLGLLIAQRIMLSLKGRIQIGNRADGVTGALVLLELPSIPPDSLP